MNQTDKKNVPFIVFAIVFRISIIQIHIGEFKDRHCTLYVQGVMEKKDLNKSVTFSKNIHIVILKLNTFHFVIILGSTGWSKKKFMM